MSTFFSKSSKIIIFILAPWYAHNMSICPSTRIAKVFWIVGCCGNVTSIPKTPFIGFSSISYFEHACLKLNLDLILLLPGVWATEKLRNVRISSLWTWWHIVDIIKSQNKHDYFGQYLHVEGIRKISNIYKIIHTYIFICMIIIQI